MRPSPINFAPPDSLKASLQSSDLKLCFRNLKNEDGEDVAEIGLYGYIGDSYWDETAVGAAKVHDFLGKNKGKKINVRINSPGGLVWDGIAIHNALVQHDAQVTTIIEGVAASSATLVAVAGDSAKMFENGSFFIHRAWGMSVGNVDAMAEMIDVLGEADQAIAKTLAAKTGKRKDTILNWMKGKDKKDGTSFDADSALSNGFVDEIIKVSKKKDTKDEVKEAIRAANEKELINVRLRALQLDEYEYEGSA